MPLISEAIYSLVTGISDASATLKRAFTGGPRNHDKTKELRDVFFNPATYWSKGNYHRALNVQPNINFEIFRQYSDELEKQSTPNFSILGNPLAANLEDSFDSQEFKEELENYKESINSFEEKVKNKSSSTEMAYFHTIEVKQRLQTAYEKYSKAVTANLDRIIDASNKAQIINNLGLDPAKDVKKQLLDTVAIEEFNKKIKAELEKSEKERQELQAMTNMKAQGYKNTRTKHLADRIDADMQKANPQPVGAVQGPQPQIFGKEKYDPKQGPIEGYAGITFSEDLSISRKDLNELTDEEILAQMVSMAELLKARGEKNIKLTINDPNLAKCTRIANLAAKALAIVGYDPKTAVKEVIITVPNDKGEETEYSKGKKHKSITEIAGVDMQAVNKIVGDYKKHEQKYLENQSKKFKKEINDERASKNLKPLKDIDIAPVANVQP